MGKPVHMQSNKEVSGQREDSARAATKATLSLPETERTEGDMSAWQRADTGRRARAARMSRLA